MQEMNMNVGEGESMEEDFLPVGSVVLLKEATRPVVVIGYMVVEEGQSEIWDYLGCAYPIGVIGNENNLLFQKNQIDKVLHIGFANEEGKQFLKDLGESVSKIKNE